MTKSGPGYTSVECPSSKRTKYGGPPSAPRASRISPCRSADSTVRPRMMIRSPGCCPMAAPPSRPYFCVPPTGRTYGPDDRSGDRAAPEARPVSERQADCGEGPATLVCTDLSVYLASTEPHQSVRRPIHRGGCDDRLARLVLLPSSAEVLGEVQR